jgi:hypothetical protein
MITDPTLVRIGEKVQLHHRAQAEIGALGDD